MRGRWGLQAKMTASYVLVTAAAVVLVEIVVLGFVVPGLLSRADRATLVQNTANVWADRVAAVAAGLGRLPTAQEIQLGELGTLPADGGDRIAIPYVPAGAVPKPMPVALLLAPDGRVVASSYPDRFPVGGPVGATGVVPAEVRDQPPAAWGKRGAGGASLEPTATADGDVLWAAMPVLDIVKPRAGEAMPPDKAKFKPSLLDPLGFVYVQVPASLDLVGPWPTLDELGPLLGIGLLVLVVAVPVGLVFGLLSTRRLVGRVRRLAATTVAVAGGDYRQRVPVAARDEVGQLEGSFNSMAEQLAAAMATERQLAGATERARIARELHDAISQDLFSLRLLAGGLRKALPADSPLRPQVETMEQTATGTMHEMQALLLELRPVALEDAGLVPALEELCQAYSERLGVTVDAELEAVALEEPAEHAVLRVVQEALANAVKHARPNRILLRLSQRDGQVALTIQDDGAGFDPAEAAAHRHGLGLGLMRERVAELGGTFQIESTPGQGTSVQVRLPGRRA
jgi:signal transduction histidine kinase